MEELFENQLKVYLPTTEKALNLFQDKTYFNGDEIQIGDVVLFAILMEDIIKIDEITSEFPLKLIKLNKKHFNLFEYDKRFLGSTIPTIKLKTTIKC